MFETLGGGDVVYQERHVSTSFGCGLNATVDPGSLTAAAPRWEVIVCDRVFQ